MLEHMHTETLNSMSLRVKMVLPDSENPSTAKKTKTGIDFVIVEHYALLRAEGNCIELNEETKETE